MALHFLLIPFLAPGHTIPMIDMAKLLGQQPNVIVTILTTPANAARYGPALKDHITSGLPVRFLELPFPGVENGLPEGCESVDALHGRLHLLPNFSAAVDMLQERLEQRFESLQPRPNCMLSDKFMMWTADAASKYGIRRIIFDGMSCFKQVCTHNLYESSKMFDNLGEFDPFVLPGLPDRIEITRAQLPPEFNQSGLAPRGQLERLKETESKAYGMVVNSFDELEGKYVDELTMLKRGKVWCLGPLSLLNSNDFGKSLRGNDTTIDEPQRFVKWLDTKDIGSVVYACFGSSVQITPPQLIELGLGLEASESPFIWVIRSLDRAPEIEKWLLESGFEERVKPRGVIIRNWAPQLVILAHPSVGAFLTHCGWNSILEGVSAGVPMVTWPQFADQFLNEKVVVQVLGVGVSVGARAVVHWGLEEKFGVTVKSGQVKKAVERVMGAGIEGDERRKKAKLLGILAKKAVEEGGSSHRNVTLLIQDLMELENE